MEQPSEEEWVRQKLNELQIYLDARRLLDPPPAALSKHACDNSPAESRDLFDPDDSCLVFIGCNYFVLRTREQGRAMLDRQIAERLEKINDAKTAGHVKAGTQALEEGVRQVSLDYAASGTLPHKQVQFAGDDVGSTTEKDEQQGTDAATEKPKPILRNRDEPALIDQRALDEINNRGVKTVNIVAVSKGVMQDEIVERRGSHAGGAKATEADDEVGRQQHSINFKEAAVSSRFKASRMGGKSAS